MSKEHSHPIYEVRNETIVSQKDRKSIMRTCRFLKPCVKNVSEAVAIPNTLLLREIFDHNLQQWPPIVHFKGWYTPPKKWEEWIECLAGEYGAVWNQTGICDAIMSSRYQIPCNRDLLLGLVEFWCPETNTFVFLWGEATITLEDVMILGGFSVLGEPVTSPIKGKLVKIVEEMNMKRIEISRSKSKKATHGSWMKHFMENKSEIEVEHVAFLSLWLSRYVFPSLPDNVIHKHVFPVAVHLSIGRRMALAPALLASLCENLTRLKKQAVSGLKEIVISGPFQLLQLWAFERFPLFIGPHSPNQLSPGEPRGARFHKLNSKINLPLVRSALRLADNFIWRPYAANLKNWRHLSYYKSGTKWLELDVKNSDEELQSFALCLRACKLVGIDYTEEKYSPHRVARQFGFDQDLPGDFSGLDIALTNATFLVPPRSFEPGVSSWYFNWWNKCKLARRDILAQKRNKKNTRISLSFQATVNKKNRHASGAVNLKKPKGLLQAMKKSKIQGCRSTARHKISSKNRIQTIRDWPDEFDIPVGLEYRATGPGRIITKPKVLPSVQVTKTEVDYHGSKAPWSVKSTNKLSQVPKKCNSDDSNATVTPEFISEVKKQASEDSSDVVDHILLAERLKFYTSVANRTVSSHKAFPCSQSRKPVPSTTSNLNRNVRTRKFFTTTERNLQSKEITMPFNGGAKQMQTKAGDFAKKFKRAAEGRKSCDSANDPLHVAKEGSFKNPLVGLERRVLKLEKLLGAIPD